MKKDDPLSPATILPGLIVTILGGIIVAMLVGEGRFAPQATAMPSATLQPTAARAIPTVSFITITLTNHHCKALDYYVDGQLVVSSLGEAASETFETTAGEHFTQVCIPGTENCTEGTNTWTTPTTHHISRGSDCAATITVTLTNDHCRALDYYVDGQLVVSSLGEAASETFETTVGEHFTQVCIPGTENCTGNTNTWTTSTIQHISRGSDCP